MTADYTPIWRGLPKGCTQVEYGEASGTQNVDLGCYSFNAPGLLLMVK